MKNYIKNLYRYKQISDMQFKNALNNLEKIRNSDLSFYYLNMGKLHTYFGNPQEAILYLEKSLMSNPDLSSAYYNLYKCYVKVNNIRMAQVSLERFLEINKTDVNFEFVINILDAINTIDKDFFEYLSKEFSVKYTSQFGYNNLEDNTELKNIYYEVLHSFNLKDYLTCIKKLNKMDAKINSISYPMEVDTIIQLVKCLKDKEIVNYRMCLEDKKYQGIDDKTYTNILFHLYELGSYSQQSFLRMIEDIILNDSYTKGNMIIDKVLNHPDFVKEQDMINYLKGFVREKEAFSLLSKERQEEFTSRRLMAKRLYQKKRNEESLKLYLGLRDEFNLPICDYYIGKIMFRMGDFEKANEYFLNYLEQGGVKTEKAYMFLAKIEKIKKNYNLSKSYLSMMNRVHETFLREFTYLPDNKYNKIKRGDLSDESIDSADSIKTKRTRTIKMDEEDFKDNGSFYNREFDNVDIKEKLIIIRELLSRGSIETANKLLIKVEQECSIQDRPKVRQFQKNKKLYMNQKRKS